MAPWISVIVPTYNGAKYIARALESIAAQAAPDIEVVVVDDGSTDETQAVVESFGDRLRLAWHQIGHSGNWVHATNVGLGLAGGSYASLLHQDDCWLPHRVTSLRKLVSSGDRPIVLSPVVFIDRLDRRVGRWTCPLQPGRVEAATLVSRLLVQNFIAVPAPLFPLELARAVGGLDEALWYTADWDFWLKSAAAAQSIVYHPEALSAFRVHAESQTVTRAGAAEAMAAQQEAVVSRYLPRLAADDRSRVEGLASTSIAVNRALTMTAASDLRGWPAALGSVLRLGPLGISRYLRWSRTAQRVSARVRTRLRRDAWS